MILHILNQSTIFWVKLYIDKLLFLGNKIVSDNGGGNKFLQEQVVFTEFFYRSATL